MHTKIFISFFHHYLYSSLPLYVICFRFGRARLFYFDVCLFVGFLRFIQLTLFDFLKKEADFGGYQNVEVEFEHPSQSQYLVLL